MWKFSGLFLTLFYWGILLNGADLFSRDACGRILASGLRFQLTHAAPGWKTTVQNDASVQFLGEGGAFIAGEGMRREGTFAVNGGVFQLSEIVGLEKDRLKLKYHLTSERGIKSLSTNKLILIAPCAILSSRKNNGGKHGNDKAENMGNNG